MGSLREIFENLAAPFDDVKQMSGKGGKTIRYVSARQVMNRLDDVLGPTNWWDEYTPTSDGAICKLTISLEDGRTITKSDCGGERDMETEGMSEKTAYSDAFKRAAVKFGVGRYLYGDGVPRYAQGQFTANPGAPVREAPRQQPPPERPGPPPPGRNGPAPRAREPEAEAGSRRQDDAGKYLCPTSGKALFAWMKEREDEFGVAVLKVVNSHPQISRQFPKKMTDWTLEEIRYGYKVMVECWQKAEVWPSNAEVGVRRTKEEQEPIADARYPRSPADMQRGSSLPPADLGVLRKRLRQVATEVIMQTEEGVDPTYPNLLRVINEVAVDISPKGRKVDNLITCKDGQLMEEVISELESFLEVADDNSAIPHESPVF